MFWCGSRCIVTVDRAVPNTGVGFGSAGVVSSKIHLDRVIHGLQSVMEYPDENRRSPVVRI